MFERFTQEARRTVVLAQEEARYRGDKRIGPEHLLVAVFVAAPAELGDLGPTVDGLRQTWVDVEQDALRSVGVVTERHGVFAVSRRTKQRHIPFTGSAKGVLEESLRQAITLEDRYIGAEHILLALANLPPTERATRLLMASGVDPATIRESLLDRLGKAS